MCQERNVPDLVKVDILVLAYIDLSGENFINCELLLKKATVDVRFTVCRIILKQK